LICRRTKREENKYVSINLRTIFNVHINIHFIIENDYIYEAL